jgi:glycosyltransferase involved in cell wall biosynthesis
VQVRRVHFSEGDDSGWAIDEDLRLVRSALAGRFEATSLLRSEIVHAVWWVRMLPFSRRDLRGKHVLCNADNSPFYYATEPEFLKVREQVTLWIARSREAVSQFTALGLNSRFAPYTFDPALFHPVPQEDPQIRGLIEKWRIPEDRYLIANFHRDTEGNALASPKLQKGPDAFLEIVARLHEEGAPIHVLLAGPRRFYLRRTLAERGVPFTFMGEETGGRDDFGVNILPRSTLNLLYNIADLHLISSRWEGGPQSVLESAATRCKVISTPVGLAPDVLAPECLFSDITEACEIVRRDIRENSLAPHSEGQFTRARQNHTEEALRRHLVEIYESLPPVSLPSAGLSGAVAAPFRRVARSLSDRFRSRSRPLRIALLHRPSQPQASYFDDLAAEIEKLGNRVVRNRLDPAPDGVLLGEFPGADRFDAELRRLNKTPIIGFFDEAIAASKETLDERMTRHAAFDSCIVLPSVDALEALRARGIAPRRFMILPPAVQAREGEPSEPLIVKAGDDWAASRIQAALAGGRPVLYPAASHYRYLVWFGGLACAAPEEAAQKLDSLRADWSMFARMTSTITPPQIADRVLRLIKVCREVLADED